MRLRPSVGGKVYVVGAEGCSGWNWGNTDWEAIMPYAAAERSETGKLNNLCSLQVLMFGSLIDSRTQT